MLLAISSKFAYFLVVIFCGNPIHDYLKILCHSDDLLSNILIAKFLVVITGLFNLENHL